MGSSQEIEEGTQFIKQIKVSWSPYRERKPKGLLLPVWFEDEETLQFYEIGLAILLGTPILTLNSEPSGFTMGQINFICQSREFT